MRTEDLDRLDAEIRQANRGPAAEYAEVLERAIATCEGDAAAAEYLDVVDLHSELAEAYDQLGRVDEALREADLLVELGYRSQPDPRRRRAEILTRHGRLTEAAAIWDAVAADTPDDVWVYNNAGLEYGAIGEHDLALPWLTPPLIPVALAWLPADEYAEWPNRWPDLSDSPLLHDEDGEAVTHVVYCRRMEGRLRAHSEAGMARLSVVPVRSAEFVPWVAESAPDEQDPSQLRARYAADVARDPARTITWPPGRNDPCWCGSGRNYKKCCGAPGVPQ